jgi:DNA polymerase I-like protein with 3'-5' exonuclease and polymerase domains/uracil-DNA glycosylase
MNDLILGNGWDGAELMLVGDFARKYDESSGQCLSGYYNRKCNDILGESGYSIDKCYRTCVIKYYYKGLGNGTWGTDKKLIETFYEEHGTSKEFFVQQLIQEINDIKPSIIIAMGEYALRVLTDKEGIGKWRGSVLPLADSLIPFILKPPKVVASLHPADIHVDQSNEYLLRNDFGKAVDLVYQPDRPIDYHEIHIARRSADFIQFLDMYPEEPEEMTVDIETRYGFVTCWGISFDGFRGICIPGYGAQVDLLERTRMWYLLCKYLANPKIKKINQNIGYDKRISTRTGLPIDPVYWDTMLAAHTIAPEFPKSLAFLTSIYTDMSYYKDEGRDFDPKTQHIDVYYSYNVKDAISDFQIYKKQYKELEEMGMLDFFQSFVMPLFDAYYRLESVGLKILTGERDKLLGKYEGLYNIKAMEMKAITGQDINLNSPTQIGKYMEAQNFPLFRHRTPSGFMAVSTDAETLKKMRAMDEAEYRNCKIPYQHATRFINLLLLLRRIDKVLEYVDVGIHPWGRVHTNVKIGGTGSGRTSNSQTTDQIPIYKVEKGKKIIKMKTLGQSFQTVTKHGFIIEGEEDDDIEDGIIGKDVRDMYGVDKGYVLVEVDSSQAEARVVDLLAEDYEGLAEYGKLDKHCKVASMIFTDFSYEEIFRLAKREKTDEGEYMRFIGKKGKHATNYDMGDYRLANMANITRKEARLILAKLAQAYPNTKQVFHKQVEEQLRAARCLWNSFGRKRMWFKKIDSHYLKVAYSWIPQSTVSDNTKTALLFLDSNMDRTKAHLVAENHDSITALVKLGYLRTYVKLAKQALERPIDFRKCVLPRDYQLVIPCEFGIARKAWGSMKELKLKKLRLA